MNDDGDRYRRAFERAFDAMVIADDDGRYIDANRSASDLFGLEQADLVGRSIEEFTPATYDVESAWLDFRASDGQRDTFPLVRADGERRVVEYTAVPDIDDGEHLAILRDVTEREERRRKLRETQSKYQQLVEQNLVGIYIIHDREFSYVNPRLAEIFGETPEDMIGQSPFEWIVDEDHQKVRANLQKRERGEVESLKFTVTGKRSDGERFDFQVHGGRVEIGGQPAILGTLQDVTEQKERERTLKRQKERLEEFANIVSHDLRNPLNIAQGRLQLAEEECDSDHLEAIGRAHDRIDTLIEDLLLLALEGDSVASMEAVAVSEIMATCWENVETEDAEIAIDTSIVVQGDRSRLLQLGENLVRNAVEHGGAAVQVRVGDLDGKRGFFVEDDGCGIPEGDRGRIFERGVTRSENGMGVGLSIVERIADAHGWSVGVTEGRDGGARFEFTGIEPA